MNHLLSCHHSVGFFTLLLVSLFLLYEPIRPRFTKFDFMYQSKHPTQTRPRADVPEKYRWKDLLQIEWQTPAGMICQWALHLSPLNIQHLAHAQKVLNCLEMLFCFFCS
jgi:uncharacterized membrane protein